MPSPQRQLFDTEPEPWEADDAAGQLVATVVLVAGTAQEFDYLVPDALRETLGRGGGSKCRWGPAIAWLSAIVCGLKPDRPDAGD